MSTRKKDFGILKMLSGGYVAKKWIDKVTKSGVLNEVSLTLNWLGFSVVHFAVGREGGKITPCQKLFRIMQ